ncbi:glycosyltransferase family 4 protein [Desulfohalobiaceae bacterium Ax17]|uniref:glycosyltransferase family 4 protein n=1 Tax=Desulfovulcanus ferrireducens TaxID=2831190 RepID=UPI00207BA35E|nr:glycosyltransferase family 4 protein [Desulfovulcanus ferrireducens]MBT8763036.1 glycosyltransferase family 4 protein [Desulfovulcanus ferrireducens]
MKIVFIISSLGSGGAERVLTLIANYLSNKYTVTIITLSSEKPFYKIDKKIKLIQLDLLKISRNKFESLYNTVKRILILKKTLKQVNADVNISFMTHTNILSIIASKLNQQKIIASEDIEYYYYNNKFLFFIRKIVYKFSDFLIVKTFADKKNYDFLKKVCVIGNPLPSISFKIDSKKEPFILAVGRLDKQKGFDTLIEVYSKIDTDWKLYIAGEGKERENLQSLIKSLKLENRVILLGIREDIFEWYAKASIFVLSSRKEGFGNVLIEAMAFGCAVVSFDCPYGPNEIIQDGVNGLLIENQNSQALAGAIKKLIDDQVLREKLSQEALKVRETYHIKKIIGAWEEVIRLVL